MFKTILKLSLCMVIYFITYLIFNALMPFSQGLKDLGFSENHLTLLFMFISNAWVCFTIFFIIKHSNYNGKYLFLNLVIVIFFVNTVIFQLESLFFGSSVSPVLSKVDVLLIMLSNLFPLLTTIPLMIKFFQNKTNKIYKEQNKIKHFILKIGLAGVSYVIIFLIIATLVSSQIKELVIDSNPLLLPFEIMRGIIFCLFILPLRKMINSKNIFIISVCLVYSCISAQLIVPNVFTADILRFAYYFEMTFSMIIFGILVGILMWGKENTFIKENENEEII